MITATIADCYVMQFLFHTLRCTFSQCCARPFIQQTFNRKGKLTVFEFIAWSKKADIVTLWQCFMNEFFLCQSNSIMLLLGIYMLCSQLSVLDFEGDTTSWYPTTTLSWSLRPLIYFLTFSNWKMVVRGSTLSCPQSRTASGHTRVANVYLSITFWWTWCCLHTWFKYMYN